MLSLVNQEGDTMYVYNKVIYGQSYEYRFPLFLYTIVPGAITFCFRMCVRKSFMTACLIQAITRQRFAVFTEIFRCFYFQVMAQV